MPRMPMSTALNFTSETRGYTANQSKPKELFGGQGSGINDFKQIYPRMDQSTSNYHASNRISTLNPFRFEFELLRIFERDTRTKRCESADDSIDLAQLCQ